jgi:drug/metabolite transporter (DMT)-like permease
MPAMKRVTMHRALFIVGVLSVTGSAFILWLAFHLSHEGRDIPDLINVGMILGVIGICCTSSLIWMWIRGLIMRTGIVKALVRMSRDDR